MALSEDRLDKIIVGFAFRLAREIPVEAVILFGSYAHGKAKEHSDIDLAIISDWFSDKTRIENMQYLSRVAANYDTLIEALPFTTEEYKRGVQKFGQENFSGEYCEIWPEISTR